MSYLLLKYLHILAAILMLGTTFCNGLLRFHTNATRRNSHIQAVSSGVTQLNRYLLGPSLVLLLITGVSMGIKHWSFDMFWLRGSLVLYSLLVVAFIIGYALERRLELEAIHAHAIGQQNPSERYWRLMRQATPVGFGATLISLLLLYFMLAKPL